MNDCGCHCSSSASSLNVRFSDRARLSTGGCLCVVGIVLESSRCRSRFSTQSDPSLSVGCCTHWSDGAESHAYGRALMRSGHLRLHPDHRPHLNESVHNNHSAGGGVSLSCSCGSLLSAPAEHRAIDPHAMQDDRQLARHGNDSSAMTSRLGQPYAPGLQR